MSSNDHMENLKLSSEEIEKFQIYDHEKNIIRPVLISPWNKQPTPLNIEISVKEPTIHSLEAEEKEFIEEHGDNMNNHIIYDPFNPQIWYKIINEHSSSYLIKVIDNMLAWEQPAFFSSCAYTLSLCDSFILVVLKNNSIIFVNSETGTISSLSIYIPGGVRYIKTFNNVICCFSNLNHLWIWGIVYPSSESDEKTELDTTTDKTSSDETKQKLQPLSGNSNNSQTDSNESKPSFPSIVSVMSVDFHGHLPQIQSIALTNEIESKQISPIIITSTFKMRYSPTKHCWISVQPSIPFFATHLPSAETIYELEQSIGTATLEHDKEALNNLFPLLLKAYVDICPQNFIMLAQKLLSLVDKRISNIIDTPVKDLWKIILSTAKGHHKILKEIKNTQLYKKIFCQPPPPQATPPSNLQQQQMPSNQPYSNQQQSSDNHSIPGQNLVQRSLSEVIKQPQLIHMTVPPNLPNSNTIQQNIFVPNNFIQTPPNNTMMPGAFVQNPIMPNPVIPNASMPFNLIPNPAVMGNFVMQNNALPSQNFMMGNVVPTSQNIIMPNTIVQNVATPYPPTQNLRLPIIKNPNTFSVNTSNVNGLKEENSKLPMYQPGQTSPSK